MLAVAIDANGRVLYSGFDRFAMDAFFVRFGDLLVALPARFRHSPVFTRERASRAG